jgi:hypothetical protein
MEWINLAQDRDRWWDFVNMVMNLRATYNKGNLLTSWATAGLLVKKDVSLWCSFFPDSWPQNGGEKRVSVKTNRLHNSIQREAHTHIHTHTHTHTHTPTRLRRQPRNLLPEKPLLLLKGKIIYYSVTPKMEVKTFHPPPPPKPSLALSAAGGGGARKVKKRRPLATLHAHTNGYTEGPEATGFWVTEKRLMWRY